MQKQKINFLTLQSTYHEIEVGLFENGQLIDQENIDKFKASSQLTPTIKKLLDSRSMYLDDVNFICANLGPAPFTTLRTAITTINGISYVKKIPLVGINGITTLVKQLEDSKNTIAILNAYNKSLYYAIKRDNRVDFGWQKADEFFEKLKNVFEGKKVNIIGEGISTFENAVSNLPKNFTKLESPRFSNINLIAQQGLEEFNKKNYSDALQPLYLKSAI